MYLNLLILCGILSEGIIGCFSEENIKETFDLHVRKKRLIDLAPGGNRQVLPHEVAYIVNIRERGILSCSGSILSPHHVLTTNRCIRKALSVYKITTVSMSAMTTSKHFIIRIIDRPGYFPNDLVVLVVAPPIDFEHTSAKKIELHDGPIPQNTIGTISGWQHHIIRRNGLTIPEDLRSIHVPIISNQECANIYQGHLHITDKHICTFDRSQQQRCTEVDSGAPLVVFSHLVGVLVFAGETIGRNYPDVFINLNYPAVRNWISRDIIPRHSHN